MRENNAPTQQVVDLTRPAATAPTSRAPASSLGKRPRGVIDLTAEDEAAPSNEYWEGEASPYFSSQPEPPLSSQPESIGGRFQGRNIGDLGGNVNDGDSYVPFMSSQTSEPSGSQRFRNAIEAATLGVGAGAVAATRSGGNVSHVPQEPTIKLTPDQNRVLQLVLEGKNVFFTGPVTYPCRLVAVVGG
jgi:hypothetical protein